MKRIISTFILMALIILSLNGCTLLQGKVVPANVVLKNNTDYEIEQIIFEIPPKYGSTSPMHYVLTADDESLKQGEEREFAVKMFETSVKNLISIDIYIKNDETKYYAQIINKIDFKTDEKNSFVINCDSNMNFMFSTDEDYYLDGEEKWPAEAEASVGAILEISKNITPTDPSDIKRTVAYNGIETVKDTQCYSFTVYGDMPERYENLGVYLKEIGSEVYYYYDIVADEYVRIST